MAPAVRVEEEHRGEGFRYYIGNGRPTSTTSAKPAGAGAGGESGERDPQRYGSGMVVSMTRGQGEVFTAGSCEWLTGLARGDFCTQQITRNVLDRFLGRLTR
jgi:hypothetical protein